MPAKKKDNKKKINNKLDNKLFNAETQAVLRALLSLKNLSEAKRFWRDLLTAEEIKEFGLRWKVARLLYEKVPYLEITALTGLSSTTIARIQRWLQKGRGGYQLVLHHQSTLPRRD